MFSADTQPAEEPTHDELANLATLVRLMTDDDAARLQGDLLRHAAVTGWKIAVGTLDHLPGDSSEEKRAKGFYTAWYRAAQTVTGEWSLLFNVTLVSRNRLVPAAYAGGLRVRFRCEPGRTPRYEGYSVHT